MAAPPVVAYVSLGSNLGDRLGHLEAAVHGLTNAPQVLVVAVSSVYETAPVDAPPQPDFLNAVARLKTSLGPEELLDLLLELERRQGRDRGQGWDRGRGWERDQRWEGHQGWEQGQGWQQRRPRAPRTLDLDLLLYGTTVLFSPRLCLPHPGLRERAFVLAPLLEVAEEDALCHPQSGELLADLLPALLAAQPIRRLSSSLWRIS